MQKPTAKKKFSQNAKLELKVAFFRAVLLIVFEVLFFCINQKLILIWKIVWSTCNAETAFCQLDYSYLISKLAVAMEI